MAKNPPKKSKTETVTKLLQRNSGATIAELAKCTNWQAHSVRGFMSRTLKKKLGIDVASKKEDDKPRRYFIARGAK